MTPSPDAERAPVDLDACERIERKLTYPPWRWGDPERDRGAGIGRERSLSIYTDSTINGPPPQLSAVLTLDLESCYVTRRDDTEAIVEMRNAFPALLAELSAARERIAALVAALDEAADIAARGERACLDHIDRWRALAHPTEGDPAP